MKMIRNENKLNLNKETIVNLNPEQMRAANGGEDNDTTYHSILTPCYSETCE